MHIVASADGTEIAYQCSGSGPSLVLVNGAFRDHHIFDELVPALAPHCKTVVYDRRGRGASRDADSYSVDREIQDLAAILAVLDGPATVFAGSTGANLAVKAAMAGVPMAKLALHEPFYRVTGFPKPPLHFARDLDELLKRDARDEAAALFLTQMLDFTPETLQQWRRTPLWSANEANAHTLPYDTAICGDCEIPVDQLRDLRLACITICSDNTSDWLAASAQATAAALPNASFLCLPGSWHRVNTDVLAQTLVDFTHAA